jgi:hypothetical protein
LHWCDWALPALPVEVPATSSAHVVIEIPNASSQDPDDPNK